MSRITRSTTAAFVFVFIAACGGGSGGNSSNESALNTGTSSNSPVATADRSTLGPNGAASSTGHTPFSTGGSVPEPRPITPVFQVDATARFNTPTSMTVDSAGNIYVFDSGNQVLRKIFASGSVTTLSGRYPAGSDLAADQSGNVFVYAAPELYKIAPSGESILQFTLSNGPDTPGARTPHGFSIDGNGTFYTLTRGVRQNLFAINQTGEWRYVYTGGQFIEEHAVASDLQGNLAVATNARVLGRQPGVMLIPKSTQTEHLRSVEGLPSIQVDHSGEVDDMAYDVNGNLYIADAFGEGTNATIKIIRVTPDRQVVTLLTWMINISSNDATAVNARVSIAIGNDGTIYLTNPFAHAIYKLNASQQPVLVAGKPGEAGNSD